MTNLFIFFLIFVGTFVNAKPIQDMYKLDAELLKRMKIDKEIMDQRNRKIVQKMLEKKEVIEANKIPGSIGRYRILKRIKIVKTITIAGLVVSAVDIVCQFVDCSTLFFTNDGDTVIIESKGEK